MYLSAFGNSMVIFNSLKPAAKLLDRRANISSDRLRFIVANEILCGGLFFVLMSNGDLFVNTVPPFEVSVLTSLPLVCVASAAPHMKCLQRA